MNTRKSNRCRLKQTVIYGLGLIGVLLASCSYMKMNPPPDVDKNPFPPAVGDNSCWMATASNMLAGAGYGSGSTVQTRAEDIYNDLTANFGVMNGGWTDTALNWWLASAHNTWTSNPYTIVDVYGYKSPRYPWNAANGSQQIANNLRACNFVGLSISWPTAGSSIGSGGHAITSWGDGSWSPFRDYNDPISTDPSKVRLTDSDNEDGGNIQAYRYDSYTNPNPGGPNEGNGWYIDYDPNHPYIKHIAVLSPAELPGAGGGVMIQRVVGSYKIHQSHKTSATDLHYKVGTDAEILSYITRINWQTENVPEIRDSQPQRRTLDVDWDLTDKPVPFCKWITITTEFILRNWNAISYEDVHFTYPPGTRFSVIPNISWEMRSELVPRAERIPNVSGGYVIAGFTILDPSKTSADRIVGEYRLIHQYSFTQSPEQHSLLLRGEVGYQVSQLSFGHSYGMLDTEALWEFDDWMTELGDSTYALGDSLVAIPIDWSGRLPYPEGEDIKGRIPKIREK